MTDALSAQKKPVSRPTLSVVMPNYNHAHFLPVSLQAILDQSYAAIEVIVVDDASTDNSLEILEELSRLADTLRIYRNDRNRGVIYSCNKGLGFASGDYVYCAAADDKVLPGAFEKAINLLSQFPEAGLCSTLSGIMNEAGEYQGITHVPVISSSACFLSPAKALATLRRHGSWFMGNTVIYRRSALINAGGFIPELGPYCDGFIDLVLVLKYGGCFIPEPLAMWRKMPVAYSEIVRGNPDMTLEIMRTAKVLMGTTYRDLFPPEYIEDWEKGFLFAITSKVVSDQYETQIAELRRLSGLSSPVDKLFFKTLKISMTLQAFATKCYLFVRFKRGHLWQDALRKLKHLVDPRLTRALKHEK